MKTNSFVFLLLMIGIALNATAAPPQVPLTVTVQGDGVVISDPAGITCPTDCDESYRKNSTITLTATANPNSSFLGWNGACVGIDPVCVTKLTTPTTVTANFQTVSATSTLPATGQTTCWDSLGNLIQCSGTGQDGDVQAGVTLSFTDNGDGTISDNNTNLMWEKKDDNNIGGVHDMDNTYTWVDAFDFVTILNTSCNGEGITFCSNDNECGAGESCGFTGYQDWRFPNIREMQSIINYEAIPDSPSASLPMVSAEFNNACLPGCTITQCSCTTLFAHLPTYWSSTTTHIGNANPSAWVLNFSNGGHSAGVKNGALNLIRAVRGGL